MHGANPPLLRIGRKLEVQPRIIHRADDIRLPLVDRPFHRPLDAQEEPDLPKNREETDDREIRGLESVIAVAPNLHRRVLAADRLCNPLDVKDARFLPG